MSLKHNILLTLLLCLVSGKPTDLEESIFWPLRNGFPLGSTITINGTSGGAADQDKVFAIDLKEDVSCAKDLWKSDTMFHMSVRYGERRYIVYNTFDNENYGTEEVHYDMPIGPSTKFAISITCLADRFDVRINGQDYFSYNHRLPYSRITRLVVRRNVYVNSIAIHG